MANKPSSGPYLSFCFDDEGATGKTARVVLCGSLDGTGECIPWLDRAAVAIGARAWVHVDASLLDVNEGGSAAWATAMREHCATTVLYYGNDALGREMRARCQRGRGMHFQSVFTTEVE